MSIISKIKQSIINSFYPKHIKCICCKGELVNKNVYDMCDDCYSNLPFIKQHFCNRCGLPFDKDGEGVCLNCKATNFKFDLARSVVGFTDKVVPLVHKFKYGGYKFLAEPLSYLMYDLLIFQNWKVGAICYVPLFLKREKARGYNQSRELAMYLSKLTGLEIVDNIMRVRDTPTQTKLSRRERKENVKDCFKLADKKLTEGKNILLIDDMFTTGSTSNEVSKLLKKSGANKVYVLTFSHAGFEQKF